jgi:hypothetical protein
VRGASDQLDATLGRRADVVEALAGQSRSRRQQVTGLPPPSWRVGSSRRQGTPVGSW